ncbi:GntR family transcriptional regulator [Croceicoccus bisphenolivorans]|uniref:GntR family transcriptional regulator n=1 Tax=Croceicoccus bisphenolivorans TaxID=1783232 RepID=UPI00082A2374|nr:GntR family transcriptional regulator [Croceicoccus bisphenolivorans]
MATIDDQDDGKEVDRSPFDRTYRGLLRGLYEGRYVPGQRLVAPDLMQTFEVGRGTIREVLNRLASSGVITLAPHRGAEVRRLSRREVTQLLDIVEMLLGLAARGAALSIDEGGNRARLLADHERLSEQVSLDHFASFIDAREAYYRTMVQLSGNEELQRLFPSAQVHIMRLQLRPFNRAGDSAELSDYNEMTQAILSGNAEQAEAAGRRHVRLTIERINDLPDRAFAASQP